MKFIERVKSAYRAFLGDWWKDPQYVNDCNREMAAGAMDAIHKLLDSGGIPRGTFADDHVHNLVVLYNQRGELLKQAAAQFRFYEQEHLGKIPPDTDKARTNAEWAERCDGHSGGPK